MTQFHHSRKKTLQVVGGLFTISVLLWIVLTSVYFTVSERYALRELERSTLTFAESSGSAVLDSPIPVTPQVPTSAPTKTPLLIPTDIVLPQPTKTSSSTVVPTITPMPKILNRTLTPIPTLFNFSGKPIPINTPRLLPTPTPRPPYPRIKIALAFPDIEPTVSLINTAQIVFYRRGGAGRWVRLSETKLYISMRRIGQGKYFENVEDIEVKIRVGAKEARYGMYIKGFSTVGRFFTGIVLKGTTIKNVSPLIQCGMTAPSVKECGELVTLREDKPLFSGDSDGFLSASPSYNTVDIRDLDYTALMYHKNGGEDADRSADYTEDGIVDDKDIAIIASHYGEWGDVIDE